MGKKLTTLDFIARSVKLHGERYSYSKSEYSTNIVPIIITCKEHGDFSQTPLSHMQGKGCPKCGGKTKITTGEFIKKAMLIHGHKYIYRNTNYINSRTKLTITCRDHGDFKQRPDTHLNRHGCPICAKDKRPISNTSTTFDFVEKATLKHAGKYSYTKSKYKNSTTKLTITCPVHGDFIQSPSSHLTSGGCLKCAQRGFNEEKEGYVYIIKSITAELMKVGITNSIENRMESLSKNTPFEIVKHCFFRVEGSKARLIEKTILFMGESANLRGFDGATEWMVFDEKLIELLEELCLE